MISCHKCKNDKFYVTYINNLEILVVICINCATAYRIPIRVSSTSLEEIFNKHKENNTNE